MENTPHLYDTLVQVLSQHRACRNSKCHPKGEIMYLSKTVGRHGSQSERGLGCPTGHKFDPVRYANMVLEPPTGVQRPSKLYGERVSSVVSPCEATI
jgi:hypothetical protein